MFISLAALLSQIAQPDEIGILIELQKIVLSSKERTTSWRLSQKSWDTTWSQEAFGVSSHRGVDTTRFRFRVPPDADKTSVGGQSPFLVEAYENGFPAYGIRKNGDGYWSRPLGIEYDGNGNPVGMTVLVRERAAWHQAKLNDRGKLVLLFSLIGYRSRYRISRLEPAPPHAPIWFKIMVGKRPVYWFDENLNVTSPFGSDSLDLDMKESIADILAGRANKPLPPEGK